MHPHTKVPGVVARRYFQQIKGCPIPPIDHEFFRGSDPEFVRDYFCTQRLDPFEFVMTFDEMKTTPDAADIMTERYAQYLSEAYGPYSRFENCQHEWLDVETAEEIGRLLALKSIEAADFEHPERHERVWATTTREIAQAKVDEITRRTGSSVRTISMVAGVARPAHVLHRMICPWWEDQKALRFVFETGDLILAELQGKPTP